MHKDNYAKVVYKYDDQNNMTEKHFYDAKEQPCLSVDNIAGANLRYDNRGNLIEEIPLGIDGQLQSGRLISQFKYDQGGNIIEFAVFDKDRNPVLNSIGYHKYIAEYNYLNQNIQTSYYNTANQLVLLKDQHYAIVRIKYDNKGSQIEKAFFDTADQPCESADGFAILRNEVNSLGYIVRQTYFDKNNNPTDPNNYVPEGIVKYDKWGNMIYIASANGNGTLINNPNTGWAVMECEYDIRGNKLWIAYFNKEKELCYQKDINACKVVYNYNNKGYLTEEKYYDDKMGLRSTEYAIIRYKYDDKNRQIEVAYFDENDKPTNALLGEICRYECIYQGNSAKMIQQKCYRANGTAYGTWDNENKKWMGQTQEMATATPKVKNTGENANSNWRTEVNNTSLPLSIGDGVSVIKIKSTERSCMLVVQFENYSVYGLSDSEITDLKRFAESYKSELKKTKIFPANIRISVVLVDKAGREILTT